MRTERDVLVRVRDLQVRYRGRARPFGRSAGVVAVTDVSFNISRGELLCIVGESGSGKTTTARAIGRLLRPTHGRVWFDGGDVAALSGRDLHDFRRRVQSVFQDPYDSLNARQRIGEIVTEPLEVHHIGRNRKEREDLALEALTECGLTPAGEIARRYPDELSGGQRQRVCIAAATVLRPELLIADEPVSMLDVSVRAEIVDMLLRLRRSHNLTIIFVTHDLTLAWAIADRIAVMYAGRLVEVGTPEQVVTEPAHPYTAALVASVPEADPDVPLRPIPVIAGFSSAPASGCCFRLRCPYALSSCEEAPSTADDVGASHLSACIRSDALRDQLRRFLPAL